LHCVPNPAGALDRISRVPNSVGQHQAKSSSRRLLIWPIQPIIWGGFHHRKGGCSRWTRNLKFGPPPPAAGASQFSARSQWSQRRCLGASAPWGPAKGWAVGEWLPRVLGQGYTYFPVPRRQGFGSLRSMFQKDCVSSFTPPSVHYPVVHYVLHATEDIQTSDPLKIVWRPSGDDLDWSCMCKFALGLLGALGFSKLPYPGG
jgi:hypothetical protein